MLANSPELVLSSDEDDEEELFPRDEEEELEGAMSGLSVSSPSQSYRECVMRDEDVIVISD